MKDLGFRAIRESPLQVPEYLWLCRGVVSAPVVQLQDLPGTSQPQY